MMYNIIIYYTKTVQQVSNKNLSRTIFFDLNNNNNNTERQFIITKIKEKIIFSIIMI